MKKLLLIILTISYSAGFAQLHPSSTDPTGFTNSMDDGTSYVYGPDPGDVTVTNLGTELQVDVGASALNWEGLGIAPYDKGATGNPANIDISSNPVVYIKMKGTVGDTIKLDLKNDPTYTFVDGWNYMQPILCDDYQWYEFDFTASLGSNPLNQIVEAFVTVNPQTSGETKQFFVDSIIIGDNNINPSPVVDVESISYETDLSQAVGFYNFVHDGSNITATQISQTYQVDIGPGADASSGIGFQPYGTTGHTYPDITSEPKVWIRASGTIDDTIRVDLKNGLSDTFIDGFDFAQKITLSGMQWYEFDFSTSGATMDSISEISISINPNSMGTESITLDSIRIGDFDFDPCSETIVTGVSGAIQVVDFKVFPNPADESICIVLPDAAGILNIQSITGTDTESYTLVPGKNFVDISQLVSGVYLFQVTTEQGAATQRVVIY